MKNRVPSLDEVAALDRPSWEDTCAILCSHIYGAHRVEDRFGKGNGLDAYRIVADTIEGWQFRRLNDRLGTHQVDEIRRNIELAFGRSSTEFKKRLARYIIVVNIDLEPGHMGSVGEIERANDIIKWAFVSLNVVVSFRGVTWVRTRLLKSPWVRPSLFEDIALALREIQSTLESRFDHLASQLQADSATSGLQGQLNIAVDTLLREATTHFERGRSASSTEEYHCALTAWDDAARLTVGQDSGNQVRGRILALASGARILVGEIARAIAEADEALRLLSSEIDSQFLWWAKGNLAMALVHHQEYSRAESVFEEVLLHYEDTGEALELVRTLQNVVEIYVQRGNIADGLQYLDRMRTLVDDLLGAGITNEVIIGTLGTVGNATWVAARSAPDGLAHSLRNEALRAYEELRGIAAKLGLKRLELFAQAGLGSCLWHMDRLDEALAAFDGVLGQPDSEFGKAIADVQYNRGLVLTEMRRRQDAIRAFADARRRYQMLGDMPSARDCEKRLQEFAK